MKRVVAALALVAGVVGVGASADAAKKPPPTVASVTGPITIGADPTTAVIRVNYRCTTADHTSPHSFISLKQDGKRDRDPQLAEEGSSFFAVTSGGAWGMSHRINVVCDSKMHNAAFVVDQIETASFGVPVQDFAPGAGYFQFCIFDDNFPIPPPPADPESGVPYDSNGFRLVR